MKALIDEYDRAIAQLQQRYPKGALVDFFIMHGQRVPSTGKIIGVAINFSNYASGTNAYATVRIWHDQSKPGGRYPVREVEPDRIVAVYPQQGGQP